MPELLTVKTPQSHPTHHTVGGYFSHYPNAIFYCDSYDPKIGYWMTPIYFANLDDAAKDMGRRNVSERAVGGNGPFREIFLFGGREGKTGKHLVEFDVITAHRAKMTEIAQSLPPLPPKNLYSVTCLITIGSYFRDEVKTIWRGDILIESYFEKEAIHLALQVVQDSDLYRHANPEKPSEKSSSYSGLFELSPAAAAGINRAQIAKMPAEFVEA